MTVKYLVLEILHFGLLEWWSFSDSGTSFSKLAVCFATFTSSAHISFLYELHVIQNSIQNKRMDSRTLLSFSHSQCCLLFFIYRRIEQQKAVVDKEYITKEFFGVRVEERDNIIVKDGWVWLFVIQFGRKALVFNIKYWWGWLWLLIKYNGTVRSM